MSVTFYTDADSEGINVCNANAVEILETLGIEFDSECLCRKINSAELAIRCQDAIQLIDAAPELDPGKPTSKCASSNWPSWLSPAQSFTSPNPLRIGRDSPPLIRLTCPARLSASARRRAGYAKTEQERKTWTTQILRSAGKRLFNTLSLTTLPTTP